MSDAPSAPNRAPTDEAHAHEWVYEHVSRPHIEADTWGCAGCQTLSLTDPSAAPTEGGTSEAPSSRRPSDQRPMLSTADRDALIEAKNLAAWYELLGMEPSRAGAHVLRLAVALEDLTRENERLRAALAQMTTYRDNAVGNRRGADAEVDSLRDDLADLRRQVAAVRALAPVGFKHPDDEWAQGYNHALTDVGAALDTASDG